MAACYNVAYSDCIDMDHPAIKQVARLGAKFDELIPLLPSFFGVYKIPDRNEKKLIIAEGFHEAVKKNG